jgi:hypothetical protein
VTVDLAEIFFLSGGEYGFVAGGGESDEQRKLNDSEGWDGEGGDAGEPGLPGEPED